MRLTFAACGVADSVRNVKSVVLVEKGLAQVERLFGELLRKR
jgi:hypothetical protein